MGICRRAIIPTSCGPDILTNLVAQSKNHIICSRTRSPTGRRHALVIVHVHQYDMMIVINSWCAIVINSWYAIVINSWYAIVINS